MKPSQSNAHCLELCHLIVVALDTRYAQHFARVPKDHWNQCIVPVSVTLQKVRQGAVTQVPYLLMTDADHVMHRVLVDEKLIREARRCCTAWNTLRELGGINNSHAQRLLEKEKAAWQSSAAPAPEAATPVAETLAAAQPVAAPEKEAEKSSGEAYIETPRCASCNECIQMQMTKEPGFISQSGIQLVQHRPYRAIIPG